MIPPLPSVRSSAMLVILAIASVAEAKVEVKPVNYDSTTAESFRIPILIDDPATASAPGTPLYAGVPFPKGWLKTPSISVIDEAGKVVPSASWMMAKWPENDSIRWLGVDFQGDPKKSYFVVPAKEAASVSAPALSVRKEGALFLVDTGSARFVVPTKGPLFRSVYRDFNNDGRIDEREKVLENGKGDDLYIIDQDGREGIIGTDTATDQVRVEESGKSPMRIVLRREGWYLTAQGEKIARHITRLHFYAGKPFCKIEHSLVVTEDTNKLWFRDYGLRLRYAQSGRPSEILFPESTRADASIVKVPFATGDREIFLFQEKAFHFSNMDEQKDCRFEIGKVNASGAPQSIVQGTLAGDWILARNRNGAIGVTLRDLWQQFPKELASTPEALVVRLWSNRGGDELDFRAPTLAEKRWPKDWIERYPDWGPKAIADKKGAEGIARTHEMMLDFGPADGKELIERSPAFSKPAICLADPYWLRKTEAMGTYHPYDPEQFPKAEGFMETWFDQLMAVYKQWGEFGFFDFSAAPHTWYRKVPTGNGNDTRWEPYLTRYGVDYGVHGHFWRLYARSGDRKYFDAANGMTRHWLDFKMVHTGPMQGLYRTSVYSPRYWAANPSFHHQSGTDIRALAYLAYLTDNRAAREMLGHYANTVKSAWEKGNGGAFRGSRPFANLKNIATVYQETGDPALRDIAVDLAAYLTDLKAPQGIGRDKEATGLAKYGVKAGAMQRVYEVMGDELAGKSLTKGAYMRSKTSLGNAPFSYYNSTGEQLSEAYRITGDAEFARMLQRDMETAIAIERNDTDTDWTFMLGTYPSMGGNPYPLGGMAYAMDVVSRYTKEHGKRPESIPFTKQAGFGRVVVAAVEKPAGKAVRLEVRSESPLNPNVFDAVGNLVTNVEATVPREYLYTVSPTSRCWELTLPAGLPAGTYYIDSGAGGERWEVTWSDAPKLILVAPGGVISGGSGRRWGNRIPRALPDHAPWVYFEVPQSVESFEVYSAKPLKLKTPEGEIREIDGGKPEWRRIAVPAGSRGKLWAYQSKGDFVELRGVPPFLAFSEPERYFAPVLSANLEEQFGFDFTSAPYQLPPEAFEVASGGQSLAGQPASGVVLGGGRRFQVPLKPDESGLALMDEKEGTLEFWLKPSWSSVYLFGDEVAAQRALFSSGPWSLFLHRYGEMSITALIKGAQGGVQETNAGAVLEAGRWTHFAFQWRQDGGKFLTEFYVNGRGQGVGTGPAKATEGGEESIDDEAEAAVKKAVKDFTPANLGGELFFGSKNSTDAVLGGLRFSSSCRYGQDFNPYAEKTMESDAKTTGLFLFNESPDGVSGATGHAIQGQITGQ